VIHDSPDSGLVRHFKEFRCNDCGSNIGFRSRRRSLGERYILPFMLLQPVRCAKCFRRDYRLIFTQVGNRLSDVSGLISAPRVPTRTPHNRNVA
jgi:hypothetical protein